MINPFVALTITCIVGAIFSAVMYFLINRGGNLLQKATTLTGAGLFLINK
jgi:hypothetical protein